MRELEGKRRAWPGFPGVHEKISTADTIIYCYHRVSPSFDAVGGSNASTRSSSFGMPSTFEMKSMPTAAHNASACKSVFIVKRMTGVSGIAFFKTVAASAPFNRGIARSRSIKSGRDFFSLLDSVYAVNSLADYE